MQREASLILHSFSMTQTSETTYWNIDKAPEIEVVKPDKKLAIDTVANSLTFVDSCYTIGMPWKHDECSLPDNYRGGVWIFSGTTQQVIQSNNVCDWFSQEQNLKLSSDESVDNIVPQIREGGKEGNH